MLRKILTVSAMLLVFPVLMAAPALADIAVDGVFGPATDSATKDFQRDAGISVDGVVGPETRDAMDVATGGRYLRLTSPYMTGGDVSDWQQNLNSVGADASSSSSSAREASSASRSSSRASSASGLSGIAREVARCESGLDPNAENPVSSASGLFQFIDGTWESVTGLSAPASAYSVATQTDAFYELWNGGAGAHHWNPSRHCWG